jgi:Transposase DDE domain
MSHRDDAEDWLVIEGLLPPGWREKARELGATRRERILHDPARLLRALLAHVAQNLSLAETALRIEQAGWGPYSAVALWKRLPVAGPWISWIAQALFQRHGLVPALAQGRLLAVDGTLVKEPGAGGRLWRVHWMVRLEDLQCQQYLLSSQHTGESFRRFVFAPGDVVLADRAYSKPPGIAQVLGQGAHVVVRVHPGNLPLYDLSGGRIDLLQQVRPLRPGQLAQWPAQVRSPEGQWLPGRLIVRRLSNAQAERVLQQAQRRAQDKQRRLSARQRKLLRYVLLWTDLELRDYPAREILRLYRLRWQIELVFKRLKSILGLGQLPKRSEPAAAAWLQAKLLLVLLIERLWEQARGTADWGLCRRIRCSPWREARYLLHAVAPILLPQESLTQTVQHWSHIAKRLAESPRKRPRQAP